MAKRGRPPEDLYLKWVKGKEETIIADCRNGADNKKIAERLGCGLTTLLTLGREYPAFKVLVKDGKEVADLKVESALYRSALGYEYEETVTKVTINKDGVGQTTHVEKKKCHKAGDTTAQIFFLKNRKKVWRDTTNVELTGKDGSPLNDPLSHESLRAEAIMLGVKYDQ